MLKFYCVMKWYKQRPLLVLKQRGSATSGIKKMIKILKHKEFKTLD